MTQCISQLHLDIALDWPSARADGNEDVAPVGAWTCHGLG